VGRNQQVNYRVGLWNDSFAGRRAPSSARRLAILPVAQRFESWNFYRVPLAATQTAVQFLAGP